MATSIISMTPVDGCLTQGAFVVIERMGVQCCFWAVSEAWVFDTLLERSRSVLLRNTLILRRFSQEAIESVLRDADNHDWDVTRWFPGPVSNQRSDFLRVPNSAVDASRFSYDPWDNAVVKGYDVWYFDHEGEKNSCTILSRAYFKEFFDLSDKILESGAYLVVGIGILARDFHCDDLLESLSAIEQLAGDLWDFCDQDRVDHVAGGDGRLFS